MLSSFTHIDWPTVFNYLSALLFLIIAVLVYFLIDKIEETKQLKESINKLKRAFNELDEQAKLIVKTDLELNKAQEELDKRLKGLEALQKTSRLITTTLDENEIFVRLGQPLMTDLGFEKNLIMVYEGRNKLECRAESGFSSNEVNCILQHLEKENSLNLALREGHTFSSVSSPKQRKEQIVQLFGVEHFVLAPILSQNGIVGIVFVGNRSDASAVTEGDEELISILANQIGQSLENTRLFEQVYRSSQALESKVQERTKQLASALENVQEISKNKSEFISAVSHELRTPLTSIKGYAALLITGKLGDIPEQVKDRLEKINKHSDNLVKMINDLLDIARIESGRAEMNFKKQKIVPIIESVHDLLTPQMKEKSINWNIETPQDTPEILIDGSQIERVFINLIGNAIKFNPANGKINIKIQYDKDNMTIETSDTGIGISEENIPKLFTEFYRVENEENQGVKGSGLGLALAKQIIEAHRGKIWVTSKLHAGSTFHLQLPLNEAKKGVPA
ncbi:MAG: ATP-binding protein [Candidatus Omnitrophota bacterium]